MVSLSNVSMQYGGRILFRKGNLQLFPKSRYGLVGPNGSGKSTLFKIIMGEITPESGDISIPNHMTIGSLNQDHYKFDDYKIRDVVVMGKKRLWDAISRKEALISKPEMTEEDCNILGDCEKIIEEMQGYSADSEASQILDGLGILPHVHDKQMHILSGGHKLRVLLAQLLFSAPDLLILDEPTNHLDIFSIHWLEEYLKSFPKTIFLSSHDRHFLNAVCTHIVDIDYTTITTYKGNFDQFENLKSEAMVLKEAQLTKHEKRKEDMMSFVERFGAKATKAGQAQSRVKMVEKLEAQMESIDLTPTSRRNPKVSFEICRPSGAVALRVKELAKAYGDKQVLHNVTFEIERGEKVAFVGANGIGKSTLLEILTKHQNVSAGAFEWGFEAHVAYFPQEHKREVSGNSNLLDWLNQFAPTATREELQRVLARALFSGDDVKKQVGILSGGETARLILAKMMISKHNVLIFDEPTNHLDMEAIDNLIQALQNYKGTILFVSHNRYFVERLAQRVIEMTPHGISDFKCTYPEYVQKRDLDHLDINKAMRLPDQQPSAKGNKTSHEDLKKKQRIKEQLQRKIDAAEKKVQSLEKELQALNDKLADPTFYTTAPKEEQEKLAAKRDQLETNLEASMQDWEHQSQSLIDCEL